jgi:hypothetical protein
MPQSSDRSDRVCAVDAQSRLLHFQAFWGGKVPIGQADRNLKNAGEVEKQF